MAVLANAVAVANGKGGVGKTSVVAGVGGIAALSGWRVLAVDLDPQGNLGTDLGYEEDGRGDSGRSLAKALAGDEALTPLPVRSGLDVIPGGEAIDALEAQLVAQRLQDSTAVLALAKALAPVVGDYDLVLVDCPPSSGVLVEAALAAAHYLVIPTKGDAASLNGLAKMARQFAAVRAAHNADLELLGVILFDFGARDTRIVAKARAQLEDELGGAAPVFSAFVRNARRAADDMRELGLLAYEYEREAANAKPWYERPARRFSASASSVAGDYQRLTEELLAAYSSRRAAVEVTQ